MSVNGDKYEGEFLNGIHHGYGIEDFKEGAKYEGNYYNGER